MSDPTDDRTTPDELTAPDLPTVADTPQDESHRGGFGEFCGETSAFI